MSRKMRKSAVHRKICGSFLFTAALSLCFLCGGLFSCLMVSFSGEGARTSLSSYLQNYVTLLCEGNAVFPSIGAVVWEICCWPLLALVLGFTALGALAIPAVFCVRGFLLAYAISSFVKVFGLAGIPAALVLFGVTVFLSIPVLFALGNVAFYASLELAKGVLRERISGIPIQRYVECLPVCCALIILAVFLQYSVIPPLLQIVSGFLVVA